MASKATYLGYRAANVVARALPEAALPMAGRLGGRIGPRVMPGRAAMAARHQQRVDPTLSGEALTRTVEAVFASYVRYWLETFRLPGTPPEVLDSRLTLDGYEHLAAGLEAGRGAILALPHLGGWEWGGFWLNGVAHHGVSAVVENVEPPELAEWFVGLRRRYHIDVIPLDRSAGTRAGAALAAGNILCLLCDRDIGGGGTEVDFFGERTTIPAGPATLALRSGAPLLPAAVYFDGDHGHIGTVLPPIDTTRRGRFREDVARVGQALADDLEVLIRRRPEQWHLLQPNWPSDSPGGRPA